MSREEELEKEVAALREELEEQGALAQEWGDAYRREKAENEAARALLATEDVDPHSMREALDRDEARGAPESHVCKESRTCCCYQLALEPDEKCPVHGAGEWPPRCETCGKFIGRAAPPAWPRRCDEHGPYITPRCPSCADEKGHGDAG